jgi:lipopolysaccharide export system protein LptA
VTIGPPARLFLVWCAAGLGLLLAASYAPLAAQGLGLTDSNDKRPLDVEADQGIEWQQDNQVYIARGNARATRGNATLYADTLIAHYRPVPPERSKPPDPNSLTGSTEIYRIEADGNVRLKTEAQTVFGDHGVYDLDSATAIVTGKHLRLVTPRDVVTARDSLEWYDNKQVAVARGDALSVRDDSKRLAGDALTAQVVKPADGPSRISRIDAQGHVVVTTTNEIARGATGVYNVDSGIATLAGGVTITRGDNEMRGQYGVVDLNKNVSRLLSGPPGDPARRTPVQGLVIPRGSSKPPSPPSAPAPPSDLTPRAPVQEPVIPRGSGKLPPPPSLPAPAQ